MPVSDKVLIRTEGARWRSEGARDLVEQTTSGSSGEPLRFCLGRRRVSMDIAAKWRATRWWDVDIGDRELVLWASAIETGAQDSVRRWRDRLLRSRLVPVGSLTMSASTILDEIRVFRPRMLFGYPSALARIAWRARERSMPMDQLGVRVAFTTSEVLQPSGVRRSVRFSVAAWRTNTVRAMPVSSPAVPGRWLAHHRRGDDRGNRRRSRLAAAAREAGEIVVTNLLAPEFPFIRYRTGDRGALAAEPCACGRGLPLLSAVAAAPTMRCLRSTAHGSTAAPSITCCANCMACGRTRSCRRFVTGSMSWSPSTARFRPLSLAGWNR